MVSATEFLSSSTSNGDCLHCWTRGRWLFIDIHTDTWVLRAILCPFLSALASNNAL